MTTIYRANGQSRTPIPVVLGIIASLPAFGLQVGTGGAATIDYIKQRGAKGYAFARYDVPAFMDVNVARSPAEDLQRIRAVLQPAVTDLAKALNVSRQAIYDWQAGKPIASENASRLADLASAADVFATEGLTGTSQLLRRPLRHGKNLFQIVREGESAEDAARALVGIVQREAKQRQELKKRFANRGRPSRDVYEDIGTPMLDEEG